MDTTNSVATIDIIIDTRVAYVTLYHIYGQKEVVCLRLFHTLNRVKMEKHIFQLTI